MKSFMAFPICSFIFIFILAIIYFLKPRVKSIENTIYKYIIITNILGLIFEILCYFAVDLINSYHYISMFILKGYVVYIFVWSITFNIYVFITTMNSKKKNETDYYNKVKIVSFVLCFLFSIIVFILPIYVYNDGMLTYSYGPSVNLLLIGCGIVILIWIIKCIQNIKKIKTKKYIPIIVCIFVLLVVFLLQSANREILIATTGHSLIIFIMYFTIENPDMKMIEQLKNTYLLNDKINKDREYSSFKTSQEIKKAISLMDKISEDILANKCNPDEIEKDVQYSKDVNRELQVITNKILDISSLDSSKLRIINNEYNVQYLFDEIDLYCKKEIPNNIEFRSSFSENIPNKLYGDDIRLKQIIYTILDNSIKHTKKGFIELDVQCIIKYDVCRLIITMEDSGIGMDIMQVNDLLESEKELSNESIEMLDSKNLNLKLVKKLIHFIGGTINISSTPDRGTKTRIILDQKIPESSISSDEKYIEKYKVMLNDKKKIVIITEIEDIKNKLQKFILNTEYNIQFIESSKECLDKVRDGEEIDLILVQEDMPKIDAYELLEKLKVEKNFKASIMIIAKNINSEKKNELIHSGFKEVITLPLDRSSINNKISHILSKKDK